MRNKKILTVTLTCCIGILTLSVGYGYWTDRLRIEGKATMLMYATVNHDITPTPVPSPTPTLILIPKTESKIAEGVDPAAAGQPGPEETAPEHPEEPEVTGVPAADNTGQEADEDVSGEADSADLKASGEEGVAAGDTAEDTAIPEAAGTERPDGTNMPADGVESGDDTEATEETTMQGTQTGAGYE